MVTPIVIGGFAVIDGAVLGQFGYAIAQYRKNHEPRDDEQRQADRFRRPIGR